MWRQSTGDGNLGYAGRRRRVASAESCRDDGAYDIQYKFSLLKSLGIFPLIRVHTNSNTCAMSVDKTRSRAVLDQLGGRGSGAGKELGPHDKIRASSQPKGVEREDKVRAAVNGGDRDTGVQAHLWGVGGFAVAHHLY